jgi:hypothetical protein
MSNLLLLKAGGPAGGGGGGGGSDPDISGSDPYWADVKFLARFGADYDDQSTSPATGVVVGTPSRTDRLIINADGDGVYYDKNDAVRHGSGAVTIEFLYMSTDKVGDAVTAWPIITGGTSGGTTWFILQYGNKVYIYTNLWGPWIGPVGVDINDGVEHFIAYSREAGGAWRLYIDGSSQASGSSTFDWTGTTATRLYLGEQGAPQHAFEIDDVRITVGTARYTGASHTVPNRGYVP